MFYRFMQGLMRLVLRVYFRKIYFAGAAFLPKNQPIILACNHPNSFLDAVLLAVLIKEPLHFLARSDVFNTPLKKWLLAQFNLIPIYRLQEGAENLHRNEETFAQCYAILKKGGRILIFSEGICIQEKRLRPLKKGTARLAFGAETQYDFSLNLQVVPVGINYTFPTQFRQEVMISLSSPIALKELEPIYLTSPARAVLALNQKITAGLQDNVIIIPEKKHEAPLEALLVRERIKSKEFYNQTWLSTSRSWLDREKEIVEQYLTGREENQAEEISTEIKCKIRSKKLSWLEVFKKLRIKDWLLFGLGLPFFLMGSLLNILPLWLAQKITAAKVKHIEFYSSVLMVTGMVLYLVYLMVFTFLTFFYSFTAGVIFFFMLPVLGYAALLYRDAWKITIQRIKAHQL